MTRVFQGHKVYVEVFSLLHNALDKMVSRQICQLHVRYFLRIFAKQGNRSFASAQKVSCFPLQIVVLSYPLLIIQNLTLRYPPMMDGIISLTISC